MKVCSVPSSLREQSSSGIGRLSIPCVEREETMYDYLHTLLVFWIREREEIPQTRSCGCQCPAVEIFVQLVCFLCFFFFYDLPSKAPMLHPP